MDKNEYILDVQNVTKSYHGFISEGKELTWPVLKGVSFQVAQHDFIGIMGRSGCGKTTLLKTIGMIYQPDGGEVFYKGISTQKIYGENLARIRRQEIAFIFQDFYLMDSLSAKENIMLPLLLNEDDPLASAEKSEKIAERFGIGHLLGKKPYELSGGEKQRTVICRAIAQEPELILADEPTGNLDSKSGQIVEEAFKEINEKMNTTIVMVTHDPQMASCCKRVIFLKDGIILEDLRRKGTQDEFYDEILKHMKSL